MKPRFQYAAMGFALIALAACGAATKRTASPTATPSSQPATAIAIATASATATAQPINTHPIPFKWRLPKNYPEPVVPTDNPLTEQKFELGRYLFYDKNLSGNQTQSCASCHIQKLAFTDGRTLAVGSTGQNHPRNSQALVNVAYNATLTWANPVLTELEKQIQIPMFGEFPIELGIVGHERQVLQRFKDDARYQALFAAAFPDEKEADRISYKTIVQALASFVRGLISFNAPYDRVRAGADPNAMSESALRGQAMFFSEDLECHHCHTSFNLTASTRHVNTTFPEQPFFNTGLYNLDGKGAYPKDNEGAMALTNDPADMGRFRPPTLRNIALTAPYMHDGSLATLEDVIRFYERGGRLIDKGPNKGDGRLSPLKNGLVAGFKISDQQRQDLIAFLQSLTDEDFINNPRFSDPFATP